MADDTYTVTRSATIDAPQTRVYEEIADFHNWTHWSPWEELDPDLRRTYSGSEAGKGAAYAWSGNPGSVRAGWRSPTRGSPQPCAARTSASKRRGSSPASGCHSTPSANRLSGCSTASGVSSSAQPVTFSEPGESSP